MQEYEALLSSESHQNTEPCLNCEINAVQLLQFLLGALKCLPGCGDSDRTFKVPEMFNKWLPIATPPQATSHCLIQISTQVLRFLG